MKLGYNLTGSQLGSVTSKKKGVWLDLSFAELQILILVICQNVVLLVRPENNGRFVTLRLIYLSIMERRATGARVNQSPLTKCLPIILSDILPMKMLASNATSSSQRNDHYLISARHKGSAPPSVTPVHLPVFIC